MNVLSSDFFCPEEQISLYNLHWVDQNLYEVAQQPFVDADLYEIFVGIYDGMISTLQGIVNTAELVTDFIGS